MPAGENPRTQSKETDGKKGHSPKFIHDISQPGIIAQHPVESGDGMGGGQDFVQLHYPVPQIEEGDPWQWEHAPRKEHEDEEGKAAHGDQIEHASKKCRHQHTEPHDREAGQPPDQKEGEKGPIRSTPHRLGRCDDLRLPLPE